MHPENENNNVSSKDPPSDRPSDKLWGGRFTASADALAEAFTASVSFDRRLWKHDIRGSIAHASMLSSVKVLDEEDRDAIIKGLNEIADDISAGRFEWSDALEDVHMNIESALTAKIGEAGKRLHTARSRNDQVATDMRLYLRDETDVILAGLTRLQTAIVDVAEREADSIMPGFTHLQPAQPVTFGHHMMAWYQMLVRDQQRLTECRRRINQMPLGAAALAGTSFPIDRPMTAELLGFEGVCENSLDAVSESGFCARVLRGRRIVDDASFTHGGGAGVVEWRPVRIHRAGRRVLHRLIDHAAEKKTRTWRKSFAAKTPGSWDISSPC